jgi:hypothetical protein
MDTESGVTEFFSLLNYDRKLWSEVLCYNVMAAVHSSESLHASIFGLDERCYKFLLGNFPFAH